MHEREREQETLLGIIVSLCACVFGLFSKSLPTSVGNTFQLAQAKAIVIKSWMVMHSVHM